MTGTIYAQVSEWLARAGWVEQGGIARLELCETWREVAGKYGDESPPACGALLALVREAHGDPGIHTVLSHGEWYVDGERGGIHVPSERPSFMRPVHGKTEGLALAAALMGAPVKGGEVS